MVPRLREIEFCSQRDPRTIFTQPRVHFFGCSHCLTIRAMESTNSSVTPSSQAWFFSVLALDDASVRPSWKKRGKRRVRGFLIQRPHTFCIPLVTALVALSPLLIVY